MEYMKQSRLGLGYGWRRGMALYEDISRMMIGRIGTSSHGCQLIAEVVSRVPDGIHVEIGSQWGGTALIAAMMQTTKGHVYCIDPITENGYYGGVDPATHLIPHAKYFNANMKRFRATNHVTLIDKPSSPWPFPGTCDTAFIDGDHSLPVVAYDWMNIRERCTRYVVFDNIEKEFPHVQEVFDMACNDKSWRLVALVQEVGVVERVKRVRS